MGVWDRLVEKHDAMCTNLNDSPQMPVAGLLFWAEVQDKKVGIAKS